MSKAGLKTPDPLVKAGDQEPVVSGAPPIIVKRSTGASLTQISNMPFSPALGSVKIVMVTVALTSYLRHLC